MRPAPVARAIRAPVIIGSPSKAAHAAPVRPMQKVTGFFHEPRYILFNSADKSAVFPDAVQISRRARQRVYD